MQNHATIAAAGLMPARRRFYMLIAGLTASSVLMFGANALGQSSVAPLAPPRAAVFAGALAEREHKPLSEMTEAEITQRVTRVVRRVATAIDATPAQEARLIEVANRAALELKPVSQRLRATAGDVAELLGAETVDRAGLEALRAARLADAERISRTLTDALADAAEVLTPAQRVQLQEMLAKWRARGRQVRG